MINYNRLGYEIKQDLANFSEKISNGLKRPQSKFLLQMIYGILAGNKLHLSEIAHSLNENITLKKTIDRLSRNLSAFKEKETVMKNYISEVKKQINEENAVIIIDNSDITKPCSPKMEAISDVHDGSTGEIRKGYFTVETAVLSQNKKMPLPVYEKVFSAAEKGFISATHENLQCLKSLSAHFSKNCVRTLDRGFDANDYYRYFLKNDEKFVIRSKKNRNVIYNGKMLDFQTIAVDFDGTLCYSKWPELGQPNQALIEYLQEWKRNGNKLILWTCCAGEALSKAVEWCREQNLEFDAVNDNLPEIIEFYGHNSRKTSCDYYIDDRMLLPENAKA